jgi:hemoglobin
MEIAPAPLDEAAIARLVDTFYDRVRQDDLIGPVFNAAVHDWPAHKRTLTDFWCSVALRANRYRGNPMGVHRALSGIEEAHFQRWLALWRETVPQLIDDEGAARLIGHAERIGLSLRLGMGLLPRGRDLGIPIVHTLGAVPREPSGG